MTHEYFPPFHRAKSFHCPYCNVKTSQDWYSAMIYISDISFDSGIDVCICDHCSNRSFWYGDKMIIPLATNAPMPHSDMPESLIDDFNEARNIVNQSPRGAAALLRLCLQKLMVELGESGKDINKDIGSLVSKGLPDEIQQALDIVRVIGNESVHPGELDLRDDQETALQLFELINFIIEERISRKKRINVLFQKLPEGKRQGIEARDKTS
ncbi:DUF4145 domain-containing protein [Paenibacillus sp. chi10]|uniref:DUF4145 domain-containing protein n=1 Tax=Paenibacillus suaedae TaxID=3077233 RepID=A0AAJ2NBT9_9BACL|nr:DUF4145 domain-containing protein [Paenibacillus sp. chi10]MDT8979994.1 DUF4145 domain-containing protein [Paenibacillus sp. chi10]